MSWRKRFLAWLDSSALTDWRPPDGFEQDLNSPELLKQYYCLSLILTVMTMRAQNKHREAVTQSIIACTQFIVVFLIAVEFDAWKFVALQGFLLFCWVAMATINFLCYRHARKHYYKPVSEALKRERFHSSIATNQVIEVVASNLGRAH